MKYFLKIIYEQNKSQIGHFCIERVANTYWFC